MPWSAGQKHCHATCFPFLGGFGSSQSKQWFHALCLKSTDTRRLRRNSLRLSFTLCQHSCRGPWLDYVLIVMKGGAGGGRYTVLKSFFPSRLAAALSKCVYMVISWLKWLSKPSGTKNSKPVPLEDWNLQTQLDTCHLFTLLILHAKTQKSWVDIPWSKMYQDMIGFTWQCPTKH